MTTKEKLTLSVGILVSLIIGLVVLSVISLQILTATEPSSPVADYGLTRALTLLLLFGGLSISVGVWMLLRLPGYITRPFQELTKGINEIANHNYDIRLHLHGGEANAIEHGLIVCDSKIMPGDLPIDMFTRDTPSESDDNLDLKSVERNHIVKVLKFTNGNKTETARLLKIGLTTLYLKIEEYGISL